MRCIIRTILLTLTILSLSRLSIAQNYPHWRVIATLPLPNANSWISDIYFQDVRHGIVCACEPTGPNTDSVQIFYTKDGSTWSVATIPPGVFKVNAIRSISGKLYAAVTGTDVLVSSDTGASWSLSGLGLTDAGDVYQDLSGTFLDVNKWSTYASDGRGNCIRQWNAYQMDLSGDGGDTWRQIIPPFAPAYGYGTYTDTCSGILCVQDGSSCLFVSRDHGATWAAAGPFPPKLVWPGLQFLEGTAGVVYASSLYTGNGNMIYRTLDYGVHWSPLFIVAPQSKTHFPVFGPRGENAVIVDGGQSTYSLAVIWMTTDGGDGALSDPVTIPDTTTFLASCGGLRIPVPIQNTADTLGADAVMLHVSIQHDSLSETAIVGSNSRSLKGWDTVWIDYHPRQGPHSSSVVLKFDNEWRCSKWTEFKTLNLLSLTSIAVFPPPALTGNCVPTAASGFVQLDSCQSIVITQVVIPSFIASRLQFQGPLPDTVRVGYHDSLAFLFDPHDTSGNFSANVEFVGHYLASDVPFDQTIQISMSAQPQPPALLSAEKTLDFSTVMLCQKVQPKDTSVLFVNTGCTPDTLTDVAVSGVGFSWLRDSLPIVIASGDSVRLRFRFVPPDSGSFSGTAMLTVTSMGLTQTPQLGFSGAGVRGTGVLDMRSTSLQAGSFSFCGGDTTLTDTLRNMGCDTLFLHGASLGGDTSFTLLNQLPQYLLPQDSAVVRIQFSPRRKGSHAATLSISTKDSSFDIPVAGVGLPGSRIAALSTRSLDFGSTRTCEQRDTTFWLKNTGCDTLTLFGDSLSGGNRSYATNMSYPLTIPPGDSTKVQLHFTPDTTGQPASITGTLIFNSNSDLGNPTLPLQASIAYPSHFSLALANGGVSSVLAGQDVTIRLTRQGTIPTGLSELDFNLQHDDDLLAYDHTEESDIRLLNAVRLPSGDMSRTFAFSPVVDRPTLATMHFHSYLATHDSTSIAMTRDSLLASGGLAASCIALVDSMPSSAFHLILVCGQAAIQNELKDLPIIVTQAQVVDGTLHITIQRNAPGEEIASAEIMDVLGESRAKRTITLDAQTNNIEWNLAALRSGAYFLRVTSGGFAATRRLLVVE